MQSFIRLRSVTRFGRILTRGRQQGLTTKIAATSQGIRRLPFLIGAAAGLCAGGLLYEYNRRKYANLTYAAAVPKPQQSVVSGTKQHALYLTIHLNEDADVKECAKIAANLQNYVNSIIPPKDADEEDEVWAGVAFGPNFYAKCGGNIHENYTYPHRNGHFGKLPSTGGDVFIHAKSNNKSNLFELAQLLNSKFERATSAKAAKDKNQKEAANAVEKVSEIYGFVFQNGRDLSGFIDGTENPADEEHRCNVAVNKNSGGSYLITQQWVHDFPNIRKQSKKTLEEWIGRTLEDSVELRSKPIRSHIARMTGGNRFDNPKKFEIVRQSQPYGLATGDAGLFFIAYAASPQNFEFMLKRMVGADKDGEGDSVMLMTKCVSGTYWYMPSIEELAALK